MDYSFWKNKRVLITGHTGFKGSWLSEILIKAGAEVHGYALENNDEASVYNAIGLGNELDSTYGDICDENKLLEAVKRVRPEVVFHLAAQPLVRASYEQPVYTFQTNVLGTATLFNVLREDKDLRAVINVTTDKVYENNSGEAFFDEKDRLGGNDPYSASKACSEIVTSSFVFAYFNPKDYGKDHNVAVATARAGNVIGGGDVSRDRIVPDCIRAIKAGKPVKIRNAESIRPWQNVLEPLAVYIVLAEKLYTEGVKLNGAYNIGPGINDCIRVQELIELMKNYLPGLEYTVDTGNSKAENYPEASMLTLNTGKVHQIFGINNKWNIDKAVKKTAEWYSAQLRGEDMKKITDRMIEEYFGQGIAK